MCYFYNSMPLATLGNSVPHMLNQHKPQCVKLIKQALAILRKSPQQGADASNICPVRVIKGETHDVGECSCVPLTSPRRHQRVLLCSALDLGYVA